MSEGVVRDEDGTPHLKRNKPMTFLGLHQVMRPVEEQEDPVISVSEALSSLEKMKIDSETEARDIEARRQRSNEASHHQGMAQAYETAIRLLKLVRR
jgi:hypothetical protein